MVREKRAEPVVGEEKGDVMIDRVEIMPLKDFILHSPPTVTMQELKKGETAQVPTAYLDSLRAEKVI
jgi:hypothetical protein